MANQANQLEQLRDVIMRTALAFFIALGVNQVCASDPWPAAAKAPVKAPPGDYPQKPTGWRIHSNADGIEREWRDATGQFSVVSREYEIALDHKFFASAQFQRLPMEIQNRLLEPVLLYRAYFIKNGKYFEIPTPLAYTFEGAAGRVEMWYKGDKLDMVEGVAARGDKYHKKSGEIPRLLPGNPK